MESEASAQILGGMFSRQEAHKNSATNALGGNLNGIRLNKRQPVLWCVTLTIALDRFYVDFIKYIYSLKPSQWR
jgi:hypothetical protein